MKFRSILAIAALAVFSFTACEETENLGEAKVSVSPAEVTFDATGEKSEVVALTATRDWHIDNKPDWVVVNPSTSKASAGDQAVTISVDPNKGNDREDDVIFTIGLAKASLHVKQAGEAGELKKGSGTLEDPYSVAGVIEYVQSLGADVQSAEAVYVRGKVSTVTQNYTYNVSNGNNYGNARFNISDNGEASDEFICYNCYYMGSKQKFVAGQTDIEIGDDVIVCGNVVNYKGNTPEFVSGNNFLYSLDGVTGTAVTPDEPLDPKGSGTKEDPFNVDGVIAYVKTLAADVQSTEQFYVKGKISTVTQNYTYNVTNGNTWGNARFNISDSGEAKNEFICYNCFYFGGEKFVEGQTDIKVGDEVIVVGNVVNYKGNTPEFASGKNHLYSLNGATSSETKPTFGVEKTEITVGAAATSATIKVTGNVAWTASSSDATVNPASGQGAGEITVTFAANTDTENAKTYTVVVSTTDDVATKSYTVTITQSKASAAGDPVVVEVNFATLPSADFPSGSANGKTSGTYTFDGYEFSFNATTKFYWNTDGYVLFGKKDSYILLPSVQGKSLTSISFKTGKGASTSVMVGVSNADGSSVVKAAEKLEKQNTDYTWEIAGTVGAQYRIVVTSAHNAQFQNLVLKYE